LIEKENAFNRNHKRRFGSALRVVEPFFLSVGLIIGFERHVELVFAFAASEECEEKLLLLVLLRKTQRQFRSTRTFYARFCLEIANCSFTACCTCDLPGLVKGHRVS
jgi:hypothetical protein